ncbi:sodium:calcium antiporter [Crenobacter intestini]|uniref:Sodium:calcium antiporter n=1 Tax=Crenobacter intestini TaxID=2563443 RepID=A0A4T0UXD5_9NEIS|nr:sodium:calcium antiporter [Crenobacter intestini]TIC83782.1 sodium:calcium antiporter [Crenobacter intestini]
MPVALADICLLAGAVVLAALGGETFLRAIVGASGAFRVPKAVVATTLAACATSSPELTVSTVAALSGSPQIGLGDALGSNVANIALIFGLALLFAPVRADAGALGADYKLALFAPLLTFLFLMDGVLSRAEALLLLAVFAGWLMWTLRAVRASRADARDTGAPHLPAGRIALLGVAGLACLVLAGRLFVLGASGVAASFGVGGYVVGVLLVAFGTSLPELVTVLLSRLRGHDDIGVGTLIGSNLFNGLAIVGVAGLIHPIAVPRAEVALTLACGITALLLLRPNAEGLIGRGRGVLLLSLYAGFVWGTLQ